MIIAINKSLAALEALSAHTEEPISLSDLAARIGLKPSNCARILETLVHAGYAEQLGRKKGYILGSMVYALASRGPYRKDLVAAAEPLLADLAARLQETASVAMLRQGRRILLAEVDGGHAVQVRSTLSQNYDPYASAGGRLLLAHLAEPELAAFLQRAGLPGAGIWPEVASEQGLRQTLAEIRSAGHALRSHAEVVGLAFPVCDATKTTAALGVFVPAYRYAGEHRNAVHQETKMAAQALTAKLASRHFTS